MNKIERPTVLALINCLNNLSDENNCTDLNIKFLKMSITALYNPHHSYAVKSYINKATELVDFIRREKDDAKECRLPLDMKLIAKCSTEAAQYLKYALDEK